MKKMNKILLVIMVIFLGACSSLKVDQTKYDVTTDSIKEPYKVMDEIIKKEAVLGDWYNNEEPTHYLTTRQIIKKDGKDEAFLNGLKTKEDINSEDLENFNKMTVKYLNKLKRKYQLKDENIKNTKGMTSALVIGYNTDYPTLAKHMMTDVATEKERNKIFELNKKLEDEMTDGDRKALRKLLNKWMKRDEFFDSESLFGSEISENTIKLDEISKKDDITSLERNNINAKAMEIAFPELISKLGRWGK